MKLITLIAIASIVFTSSVMAKKFQLDALDGAWTCSEGSTVIIATNHEPDISGGIISYAQNINVIGEENGMAKALVFTGGVSTSPDIDSGGYSITFYSNDMKKSVEVTSVDAKTIYVKKMKQIKPDQFGYEDTNEKPLICQ